MVTMRCLGSTIFSMRQMRAVTSHLGEGVISIAYKMDDTQKFAGGDDWIFSPDTNMHVVNNLKWFETSDKDHFYFLDVWNKYRPFKTFLHSVIGKIEVHGVGNVKLNTEAPLHLLSSEERRKREADPNSQDPRKHGILLKNVLHAPHMPHNILGGPTLEDYRVMLNDAHGQIWERSTGELRAYMYRSDFYRLSVIGQTRQTCDNAIFLVNTMLFVNMHWPYDEEFFWRRVGRPARADIHWPNGINRYLIDVLSQLGRPPYRIF